MAPRVKGPNLQEIKINVPPNLLTEAEAMADAIGLSMGDFHRDAWIAGVEAVAERHNKVLVNRSLREKFADADADTL